jgi:predicted XRE-type DNA-binding protein
MSEVWKSIPGWLAYEVSNRGRVRTYWTRKGTRGRRGMVVIGTVPRIIQPVLGGGLSGKRLHVTLGTGQSGGQKTIGVAYLVLSAFVRPPRRGEVARHYHDPDPYNCRVKNLRWGSRFDNMSDEVRHEGKYHSSKLTPKQVREIRRLLREGSMMQKDIATRFGVSRPLITLIKQGKVQVLVPPED